MFTCHNKSQLLPKTSGPPSLGLKLQRSMQGLNYRKINLNAKQLLKITPGLISEPQLEPILYGLISCRRIQTLLFASP